MINKYISPFKPKKLIDFKPSEFKIYTFKAGFKKFKDDLLIVKFDKPVNISAKFTKSSTPAAPILWDKKIIKNNRCKILIVNSGNANAYTNKRGYAEIYKYALYASKKFNCKLNQIYISSTGVIGELIKSHLIINKLKTFKDNKSQSLLQAAKAIMTTDTYPKIAHEKIKFNGNYINIYGIAKGSGMIAPNMGTMLSYIFIEADLTKKELDKLLIENIEDSFNSISVDGDMSTNDTVMIFSLNKKYVKKINKNKLLLELISLYLRKLMINLAKQIVSDGEGISKLIEVNVKNAKNKKQAKNIAFSIANSLLVKTAIFGEDANWGRIIMAIGKTSEKINQFNISLKMGNNSVIKNGKISKNFNEKKLSKYMKQKVIKINIDLKIGKFNKTVWSSDLSKKYIEINADYRS